MQDFFTTYSTMLIGSTLTLALLVAARKTPYTPDNLSESVFRMAIANAVCDFAGIYLIGTVESKTIKTTITIILLIMNILSFLLFTRVPTEPED